MGPEMVCQITRISLHRSDTNQLPDNAPIYVRILSDQVELHKTAISNGAANGTWRQWQSTIQVVATKFTIHVMERRRLRFDRRVGSVTVITADFPTSEAGCMCEKIFTLETSDKTYSIDAALSFSGLRAIDSNSVPTTPLSLQSPELLTPATLSPDAAVFNRTEVLKATDQVNSVTVMTSETAVDYADDLSTTISSLSQAIDFMDRVVTLVTLFEELYPITKVALEVLLDIYELVKVQTERDATIKELAMSMREVLSSLAAIKDLDKDSSLQNTVKSVMEKLIECAGFISAYMQHGFWGRFIHQTLTSQTVVSAQDFQKSFDAFQNKLDSGIGMEALETAGVEERPLSVDEIAPFSQLPRAENAHYDGNMKCLDGTRQAIIRTLLYWIDHRESGRNIFWLYGIAGSGKSTIASTVAAMTEVEDGALWQLRLGCLGGTFFCRRDDEKLHRPELIWPTIAHRLAHSYPPLRPHILGALRLNPDIGKSSIANQFRKLIAEPLSSLVSVERPPLLLVIDALDQCGDYSSREPLLRSLVEQAANLPSWLKILVSSRPESDITESLGSVVDTLQLDTSNEEQRNDVAAYVHYRIEALRKRRTLRDDWPGTEKVDALISNADGLFLWARLSLDHIEKQWSANKALSLVLSATPSANPQGHPRTHLDILYDIVLRHSSDDRPYIPLIHRVLGFVVVAKASLTSSNLCRLISNDRDESDDIAWVINHLTSVLSIQPSGVIRITHPSLIDFLTTESRSTQDFYIDTVQYNLSLAHACLHLMHSELRRDVCQIGNPSLLNVEIPAARETLHRKEPLVYCCQYWVDHIASSNSLADDPIMAQVKLFFSEHLLEWFEVLSLAEVLEHGFRCLNLLETGLNEITTMSEDATTILSWCRDATKFLRYHSSLIRDSALHIYTSALAFTPSKTWIAQHYTDRYNPPLRVTVGLDQYWSPCLLAFDKHEERVWTAQFSPDGRQVASGSTNGIVHVWDVETGLISTTLNVHPENEVSCVRFSPDGKHVVTGAYERFVSIWSVQTGDLERQLEADSDKFMSLSLAWSPDGRHIVSGSMDSTIVVWDAASGDSIRSLGGHTAEVMSLTFSLDGQRLASGSYGSVRIWDAHSWHEIHALEKQVSFRYLAFSPDRQRLAWCAQDDKVGLWDIEHYIISNLQVRRRDVEEASKASTVAFSPDGRRLAVGSLTGALTVWDTETKAVLQQLEGHRAPIAEVHFSQTDSSMLLSCGNDCTVRLWDVGAADLSSTAEEQPWDYCLSRDGKYLVYWGVLCFLMDTGSGERSRLQHPPRVFVLKAVISDDGQLLATLADDQLVRLWDANSASHLRALEGHPGTVKTLVFAPSGLQIAAVSEHGVVVWDIDTGVAACLLESPSWTLPNRSHDVQTLEFSRSASRSTSLCSSHSTLFGPSASRTVMEEDGWVYAMHEGHQVRLCFLPPSHRGPSHIAVSTRGAIVCINAVQKVTVLYLPLPPGVLPVVV